MTNMPIISTETLHGIFTRNNSYYWIPEFQRNYVWETKQINLSDENVDEDDFTKKHQVNELLRDLLLAFEDSAQDYYYMGSIITYQNDQENDEKGNPYYIIDGQQRLTTFCFIIAALYKKIKNIIDLENLNQEENDSLTLRRDQLFAYLKRNFPDYDLVGHQIIATSNNKANTYLKRYFETLDSEKRPYEDNLEEQTPDSIQNWQDVHEASEKMRMAVNQIDTWVDEHFNKQNITEFIKFMTNQLYFSNVPTKDFLEAYEIFEKSNYRGADLLFSDLVKHYILGDLAKNKETFDIKAGEFNNKWNEIEKSIVSRNTNFKFDVFVRYFFISEYKKFLRTDDILPWLKRNQSENGNEIIGDPEEFIEILHERQKWFSMLRDNKYIDGTQIKSLQFMKQYFQVSQVYAILLAACKLEKSKFERVCILLECLLFCMIWSKETYKIEVELENIIKSLSNGDYERVIREVIQKYKFTAEQNIISDEFLFDNLGQGTKLYARYIPHRIEHQIRLMSDRDEVDTIEGEVHVDHILEIGNSETQNKAFIDVVDVSFEDYAKLTYRIGNLALLHRSENVNDFKGWTPQEKYNGKIYKYCNSCERYLENNSSCLDSSECDVVDKEKKGYENVEYYSTKYIVSESVTGTGSLNKLDKVLKFFKLNKIPLSDNAWTESQVTQRENIIFHILSQSFLTQFNPHRVELDFNIYPDKIDWRRLPDGFAS